MTPSTTPAQAPSKHASKLLRTRLVLEAFDFHGTLTTATLASQLGVEGSNAFFHGRRIKHVVGDLTFSGLLVRTGANSRASGRALALFQMTALGQDHLAELIHQVKKPNTPSSKPAPTFAMVDGPGGPRPVVFETVAPTAFQEVLMTLVDAGYGVEPVPTKEVPVEWTEAGLRLMGTVPPGSPSRLNHCDPKPTNIVQLGAGKPVSRPIAPESMDAPVNRIVPLPEPVVVPPYPSVGKLTTPELDDLARLRGVYQAFKNRGETQLLVLVDIVGKMLKRERAASKAWDDYQAAYTLAMREASAPANPSKAS